VLDGTPSVSDNRRVRVRSATTVRASARALLLAQVLGALGLAAGGTAGGLLAVHVTGDPGTAGLPLAALVLGSGLAALAVADLTVRAGRRVALGIAHLGGALGAALVLVAAATRNWPLLLGGCGLLGGGNAALMLARYAAADLDDLDDRRGRAMGRLVAAASVGAVAGPNLLGPTAVVAQRLALPEAAGLFLLAVPAFGAAALILLVSAPPERSSHRAAQRRHPPFEVFRDPQIRLGLFALALTNLTMVAFMAVAPVHLYGHQLSLSAVGTIVGAHVAAMYLPSPCTGRLADAIGGRAVAALAAALLLAAGALTALAGRHPAAVAVALLLLGAGWNAGLMGGSALLRASAAEPSVRTRAEGVGELGMGVAAAAGAAASGPLLAGGIELLGPVAAGPAVIVLVMLLVHYLYRRNHAPHHHRPPRGPGSGGGRRLVRGGVRRERA
jgi:MFS family permease